MICLYNFCGRHCYEFTITRETLERLSEPILDKIKAAVEKAVSQDRSANLLLVGNATKMPAVEDAVRKVIIGRNMTGINPGTVVAEGAAIRGAVMANHIPESVIIDIVPHSLGIQVKEGNDLQKINKLIPRNKKIPTSNKKIFTTVEDNQTSVNIVVYQGEYDRTFLNHKIGNFRLDKILPAPKGTPQIEVSFDIDADCILKVAAVDLGTRRKQEITIESAIMLSEPTKKQLCQLASNSESIIALDSRLQEKRMKLERARILFDTATREGGLLLQKFASIFHERIERNYNAYDFSEQDSAKVQDMFLKRTEIEMRLILCDNQVKTILTNVAEEERIHLDYSSLSIATKIDERIDKITKAESKIKEFTDTVNSEVVEEIGSWIGFLESLHIKDATLKTKAHCQALIEAGRIDEATGILEAAVSNEDSIQEEVFYLLLQCHIKGVHREKYYETHARFGPQFGFLYPCSDGNAEFFRSIKSSLVLVQWKVDGKTILRRGTCLDPHTIVITAMDAENIPVQDIEIYNQQKPLSILNVDRDSTANLFFIRISENLTPLPLGYGLFVELNEEVFLIGLDVHPQDTARDELPEISHAVGVINGLPKVSWLDERLIYPSIMLNSTNAGQVLLNCLGEVIGIVSIIESTMLSTERDGEMHPQYRSDIDSIDPAYREAYTQLCDTIDEVRSKLACDLVTDTMRNLQNELNELENKKRTIEKTSSASRAYFDSYGNQKEIPVVIPVNRIRKRLQTTQRLEVTLD